jgi:hypothetical protein
MNTTFSEYRDQPVVDGHYRLRNTCLPREPQRPRCGVKMVLG